MSLYLKYRPKNINEIVGNEETVEILTKLISKKTKPHSYLFSGPKGCGKTTLSRILAEQYNCDDIIEINSGNNRGIDTARTIIDTLNLKSIIGGNKAYILDEVHRTTKDFQEAMLKPLEDTPDHVFFFLCTTEPEKIISTVKDRCTILEVEKLSFKQLTRLLKTVAEKENLNISKEILTQIAKNSDSNRSALVKLEKVSNIENEEKALKIAISSFEEEEKNVLELCQVLLNEDSWIKVQKILKNIPIDKNNVEQIRYAILGYMSTILLNNPINNFSGKASAIIDNLEHNLYDSGKAGLINALFSLFS